MSQSETASDGISCPICGGKTTVKDSRPGAENTIRRRRYCMKSGCGERFTTYEILGATIGIGRGRLALAEDIPARLQAVEESLSKIKADCSLAYEVISGIAVNPRGGTR